MVEMLRECMTVFGEDVSTPVLLPSEVRDDTEQLSKNKGDLFHLVFEGLLSIVKVSRIYLDTDLSFLIFILSKSDVDDEKNCIVLR